MQVIGAENLKIDHTKYVSNLIQCTYKADMNKLGAVLFYCRRGSPQQFLPNLDSC